MSCLICDDANAHCSVYRASQMDVSAIKARGGYANNLDWLVKGNHGSRDYDLCILRFTEILSYMNNGELCDMCVGRLVENGDLREMPGDYL